jgi:SAM-dependent methyltransferase
MDEDAMNIGSSCKNVAIARVVASSVLALALILTGERASFAQAAADPHMQHDSAGHHPMSAPMGDIHHSFENTEEWAKQFDDPNRDAWQEPDAVLDALQLAPTAVVADLGAGTGYFSVRLAKRVAKGKVFAVDIEPAMLQYLGARAHREHLSTLQPVLASADAANLPEPVDLVLVVDTYHHIDNRTAYFAKLGESLRPNGRLAIIDFKLDAPDGPPVESRLSPEKVTAELEAAGYRLVANHPFLPRQYFLVFQRKAS